MLKKVYEVDENGFLKEIYVANVDENGNVLDEDKKEFIDIEMPQGLYKPKWTGTEWVEGATQEEIDELTKPKQTPPTLEERIQALELVLLELL